VQRLAAAPAADEVDEAVDAAEALDQGRAPGAGGLLVEEIDGATVPALGRQAELGGQRLERLLAALGSGDDRPLGRQAFSHHGPEPTPDPGDSDHTVFKHERSVDFVWHIRTKSTGGESSGWGRQDSNLRRHSQRVYSASPLTTRTLPRGRAKV
jgi:hypothetical protein